MKITIDGKVIEAKEGQNILDAALQGDVFIPHLCSQIGRASCRERV